eukprot:Platyproteum_vivax@DN15931_c0_g1_i1.p1
MSLETDYYSSAKKDSNVHFVRSQSAKMEEEAEPTLLKSYSEIDLSKTKVGKAFIQNQDVVTPWTLLVLGAFTVYYVFSDADYSLMLTLGSMIQAFSFLLVLVKILRTSSAVGVSRAMYLCFFVLSLARLTAIMPFDSYLPFDRSGDFVYRFTELLSAVFSGSILALCCMEKYKCKADSPLCTRGRIHACQS